LIEIAWSSPWSLIGSVCAPDDGVARHAATHWSNDGRMDRHSSGKFWMQGEGCKKILKNQQVAEFSIRLL
jgi:hypothetical protein